MIPSGDSTSDSPVPVPLVPLQVTHGMAWDRTRVSVVRGRWCVSPEVFGFNRSGRA